MTATAAPASVWRTPGFRAFWSGETISQFGDRISELALPLIAVATLHATPAQVGLLTAATWAPNLLSLLVGTWVDEQARKRRLLVAADLARAVVLVSVPIAYVLGSVTLTQLFVVAVLAGAGQVLFGAAYPAFFVGLVPRASFLDANSALSASRSASFIAGPAVGGVLVQMLTAPVAVLVDAVSFVASALLVRRLPVVEAGAADPDTTPMLRRAADGFRHVVRDPYLRTSLGSATTINLFTFMAQALLVLFASRTLGLPAGVIGLAFGIGAAGGLLGAVLAPRVSRRVGVGHSVVVGAILFPAPIAALAFAGGSRWAAATVLGAAEFVSSVGVMLYDVNLNSLKASVIPDALRSRVSGAFTMVNYGIRPIGAVVGGVLGTAIGLRPTMLVAAVGGTLSVLWLVASPIRGVRSLADLPAPDVDPPPHVQSRTNDETPDGTSTS